MPRTYIAKSAKALRWDAYNRRRETCDWYRERDRLKRIETRRRKIEDGASALIATQEFLPALPQSLTAKPAHELRVTVEIDSCKRVFRAAQIPGFGWQGHSGNLITKAIRLVMAAA